MDRVTGTPSEEALSQLIQSLVQFLLEEKLREQQQKDLTVPEAVGTVSG
jgi:hypothetical protein